jgi:hypothetical protein
MAERKVHRVNANFHPNAYRDLEKLAEDQGKTKAEVLRDAIALERWFHEARAEGGRILVERDGEIREVIPR